MREFVCEDWDSFQQNRVLKWKEPFPCFQAALPTAAT